MDRNRPYDGQSHTNYGERGKTAVAGLTMRDIQDCYVRAVLLSAGHVAPELYDEATKGEAANLTDNDLHKVDFGELGPGAIGRNLGCEIERMMGIFPNLPNPADSDTTQGPRR
jgi:hypothetical protein